MTQVTTNEIVLHTSLYGIDTYIHDNGMASFFVEDPAESDAIAISVVPINTSHFRDYVLQTTEETIDDEATVFRLGIAHAMAAIWMDVARSAEWIDYDVTGRINAVEALEGFMRLEMMLELSLSGKLEGSGPQD